MKEEIRLGILIGANDGTYQVYNISAIYENRIESHPIKSANWTFTGKISEFGKPLSEIPIPRTVDWHLDEFPFEDILDGYLRVV